MTQQTDNQPQPQRQAGLSEFAELARRIREPGLLNRQLPYYISKISAAAAMLAGSIAFLLLVDNPWLQMLNAVFLAFSFGQIGYIGHDAGHRAVLNSAAGNRIIGYAAAALINVSQSWWIQAHNQHHRTPNDLDQDPHTMIPVLAFRPERAEQLRGLLRRTTAYQAFYFIPLLTLEGLNLRWASFKHLAGRNRPASWPVETALLTIHTAIYLTLLAHILGPGWAAAFATIHHAAFGLYYGLAFAPNHKGMLIPEPNNPPDFIRLQVLTTRNIRPNPLIDFIYGGLNYQVEHHLFTNLPRNQLGKARIIVQEFCQEHSIPYHETSIFRSYQEALRHLHQAAAPLRARRRQTARTQA